MCKSSQSAGSEEDAYGKQTITANGVVKQKSTVGFYRGFTGYVADNESGLMYARARMYSPGLGRFIGRDVSTPILRHAKIMSDMIRDEEFKIIGEIKESIGGDLLKNTTVFGEFESVIRQSAIDRASKRRRESEMVWRNTVLAGMGYRDGLSLYSAYFIPQALDPSGNYVCIQLGGMAGYVAAASGSVSICFDVCGRIWFQFAGGIGVGGGAGAGLSGNYTPGDMPSPGSGDQVNISGIGPGAMGSLNIPIQGNPCDPPGPGSLGFDIGLGVGGAGGMTREKTYTTGEVLKPTQVRDPMTATDPSTGDSYRLPPFNIDQVFGP